MPFKRSIHTAQVITGLVLLLACALQIYNKAAYTHSHMLEDGRIVTHAHPYKKPSPDAPSPDHSHSKNEFWFLSQSELLVFVFFALSLVIFRIALLRFPERPDSLYLRLGTHSLNNKSPPSFLLS